MQTVYRGSFVLVLIAVAACKGGLVESEAESDSDDETGEVQDALSNGATPVSDGSLLAKSTVRVWSLVDHIYGSCTGVIVAPRHVLTAAHCESARSGATVEFYNGKEPTGDVGVVFDAEAPPGVTLRALHDELDIDGDQADIAVLELESNVPSYTSKALIPYDYPGNEVQGYQVGVGYHDGQLNPDWVMKRLIQTTYSSNDDQGGFLVNDGHLLTQGPNVNDGDSGGGFLTYQSSLGRYAALGVLRSSVDEWLTWKSKYTSVPFRVGWILERIGYTGPFITAPNTVVTSNVYKTLLAIPTARECALRCEWESGCFGYSFTGSVCKLTNAFSSTTPLAGSTSGQRALHF